jgi:hypothetical protein
MEIIGVCWKLEIPSFRKFAEVSVSLQWFAKVCEFAMVCAFLGRIYELRKLLEFLRHCLKHTPHNVWGVRPQIQIGNESSPLWTTRIQDYY